jgi:hypothetical protein
MFLASGVMAILAGCIAPEPVIRMTPLSKNPFWAGGTQVAAIQGKSALVAVAFLREKDAQVSFRVEIENTSTGPVLVDPARFYFNMCSLSEVLDEATCSTSRWVVNPEQVLLDLDVKRARESADNKNSTSLLMPFMFLDIVAAVGGIATGDRHATAQALDNTRDTSDMLREIEAEDQQQASSYEARRSMWETSALRKTTILPGQREAGMVFIPRDLSTNTVKLQIRVGDEVLAFPFKQTVYQTRPQRTY